jgi:hypothetical protein
VADWTYLMLVVAAASLCVTTVGTAFLAWQVTLTRAAVKDTEQATKAMLRQNELAEESRRPWVYITLKEWTPIIIKDGILSCNVFFEVGNVGPTPANRVQIIYQTFPQTAQSEQANAFYGEQARNYGSGEWGDIIIPNQNIIQKFEIEFNIDEMIKVKIDDRDAILPTFCIVATYSEVGVKKVYQTGSCYVMSLIRDGAATVFYCEPGNYDNRAAAIMPHPGAGVIT